MLSHVMLAVVLDDRVTVVVADALAVSASLNL